MRKLKTHRGAAKRFKITAKGGVKHRQAFRNHILTKKTTSTKRKLRGMKMMSPSDIRSVKQMLINSSF